MATPVEGKVVIVHDDDVTVRVMTEKEGMVKFSSVNGIDVSVEEVKWMIVVL